MKDKKLKIKNLRLTSFITSPKVTVDNKIKRNDGGYTWVG